MESETYDVIWQVWQKEKQSTKLQQIPKTFYADVFSFAAGGPAPTEAEATTKENVRRLADNIYERRKQKMLAYLAYSQQPPQPLPPEEERFYSRLYSIIKDDRLEGGVRQNTLTATQNVPKIVLPSGSEVGPLAKDESVSVEDGTDREFLISNNLCRTP